MKFDAVLFDLDGTLTESEPGIVSCVKYALQRMGVDERDGAKLRKFIGPPLFASFRDLYHMADEDCERAIAFYRERFSRVGWMENRVYGGIIPLLAALKKQGVYIALCTGKPQEFAEKTLRYFELARYIDNIVGITFTDHDAEKEALVRRALPEGYKNAVMVGDRMYDMEGAVKNGITAAGVLYGYGSEDELKNAGADAILKTVDDLAEYLLGEKLPRRGAFITMEGSDGCGKSTQARMLAQKLELMGFDVVRTREPGGSPIAERIRDLVLDVKAQGMTDITEALLFAASRAQHVSDTILPAIRSGKIVLCDRFIDSSVAFQAYGRDLGEDWILGINRRGLQGVWPDLTLFFEIDPEEAIRRRLGATAPDRIEVENNDFVDRVYEGFQKVKNGDAARVRPVDAGGTPAQVHERVMNVIFESGVMEK